MFNLLPVPISPWDFFGSIWIIPGTLGSILGDPLVCFIAYKLTPKFQKEGDSGERIKYPLLTFAIQIILGLIRTALFFVLVFWTRHYCLENNIRGVFDGFIPENDDSDEDAINARIYDDCAKSAFSFIKLHFFIMNFAISFITNVVASYKTGRVANPLAQPGSNQASQMELKLSLLCHVASVVLYIYFVFVFVWCVIGLKIAFLVGIVHIAIVIAIYFETLKSTLATVRGELAKKTN